MKFNLWHILILSIVFIAVIHFAKQAGYSQGYITAKLEVANNTNQRYAQVFQTAQDLLTESHQLSDRLLLQFQDQANTNQNTTEELKHALAKTASNRVDCYLPTHSMQQLNEARNRAAAAVQTNTSSTQSAMPSTSKAN